MPKKYITNIDMKNKLNSIDLNNISLNIGQKLEDNLDFSFRAETKYIGDIDSFEQNLFIPFSRGDKVFYRGERKNSILRPLLPSLYRKRDLLEKDNKIVTVVNADTLANFYNGCPEYVAMYENIAGKINTSSMYDFLAFSQHYYGISPLLDFSKSLYVSLSFALKDKEEHDNDILLYTLKIKNDEDFTQSHDVADEWISRYSVMLMKNTVSQREIENPIEHLNDFKDIYEQFKGESFLDMTSPTARLIDVPTNDLMMFQQGVFLLLDDFTLMGKSYLTKKIRDNFEITKWIINKELCPALLDRIYTDRPYYKYKNITDLDSVVRTIKKKYNLS